VSDDPTPLWGASGGAYNQPRSGSPAQQWQRPAEGGDQGAYPPPPAPDYWTAYPGGYTPGGQPQSGYIPPYPGPMAPSTSGWAIASLILAIGGWTFLPLLGAIGGVVTGHIALHEIASSDGRVQGRGFAVAGLAIGYASLVLALCAGVFGIAVLVAALQPH
jgi:hypothetical protein